MWFEQDKNADLKEERYRHELKYLVSDAELVVLKVRLRHLMKRDPHTDETGRYLIRSIYFDDLENSAYYENENGVAERSKWRIRSYNCSDDAIVLENKKKSVAMTRKESCRLSRAEYDAIMNAFSESGIPRGAAPKRLPGNEHPVLNRFLIEMATRPLTPKVIVQYEREPLLFSSGNVRVTFDRKITSSVAFGDFFGSRLTGRAVMPTGQQILEVKYDDYLPDHIYHAVQLRHMRQETYSKYYMCRRYAL